MPWLLVVVQQVLQSIVMLILIFCAAYRSSSPLHAVWFPLLLLVVSLVFSYYLLRDASPFRYAGPIYVRRFPPRTQLQLEYHLRRERSRHLRQHEEELAERLLPPPADGSTVGIVCTCGFCDPTQRPRAYSAPDFDTLGLLNLVRGSDFGCTLQRGSGDTSHGNTRIGRHHDSIGQSILTSSTRRSSLGSSSSSSLPALESCFVSHSWINAVIRKKERRWARFCQRWHLRQELLRQQLELHKHRVRQHRWEQEHSQQWQHRRQEQQQQQVQQQHRRQQRQPQRQHYHQHHQQQQQQYQRHRQQQHQQQQHHQQQQRQHQRQQQQHGFTAYLINGAAGTGRAAETRNGDARGDRSAASAAAAYALQMATCSGLKEQYDRCFNHWYRRHFLRGDMSRNCFHLFADYRLCISDELKRKGLE